MKAVMMSIQPKWVEKILNGEKTIEVRKTAPKFERECSKLADECGEMYREPFKVYIYCTKPKDKAHYKGMFQDDELYKSGTGKVGLGHGWEWEDYANQGNEVCYLNGKVVAEFTCDRIEFVRNDYYDDVLNEYYKYTLWNDICEGTCLTASEIVDYMGYSAGCYRWHISDLKIYDKPRELGEYSRKMPCYIQGDYDKLACWECCEFYDRGECNMSGEEQLTRPFQSWGYVEDDM